MPRGMCVALVVLGCGHAAPPATPIGTTHTPAPDAAPPAPVPLDRDYPRLAERGAALFADLAAAFTSAGDDCAAAIAKLGELKRTYAEVVAANARVVQEGRDKELKAAMAPYEERSSAAAKAIVESKVMATCATQPAFTEAFDAVVAPPSPSPSPSPSPGATP